MTHQSYSESELRAMQGQSNWKAALQQPDDESDDADFNWDAAELVPPQKRVLKTLRLDPEMLSWFQQQGKGYQTLMNSVLCSYYRAKQQEQREKQ